MDCDALNERIEDLAGGGVVDGDVRAHLDVCTPCRRHLALARALESALAARPTPEPPARFVNGVMARIRRDRWRAEQLLDVGFNVAVLGGMLFIGAGVAGLLWTSGILAAGADLMSLAAVGAQVILDRLAGEAPRIALALVFFTVAGAVWWWIENEATT